MQEEIITKITAEEAREKLKKKMKEEKLLDNNMEIIDKWQQECSKFIDNHQLNISEPFFTKYLDVQFNVEKLRESLKSSQLDLLNEESQFVENLKNSKLLEIESIYSGISSNNKSNESKNQIIKKVNEWYAEAQNKEWNEVEQLWNKKYKPYVEETKNKDIKQDFINQLSNVVDVEGKSKYDLRKAKLKEQIDIKFNNSIIKSYLKEIDPAINFLDDYQHIIKKVKDEIFNKLTSSSKTISENDILGSLKSAEKELGNQLIIQYVKNKIKDGVRDQKIIKAIESAKNMKELENASKKKKYWFFKSTSYKNYEKLFKNNKLLNKLPDAFVKQNKVTSKSITKDTSSYHNRAKLIATKFAKQKQNHLYR